MTAPHRNGIKITGGMAHSKCAGLSVADSLMHFILTKLFSQSFGTQPHYEAPDDLQVEIIRNAVINIKLMRLPPLTVAQS